MALVSWVVDFCIAICLQGESSKERQEGGRKEGRNEGLGGIMDGAHCFGAQLVFALWKFERVSSVQSSNRPSHALKVWPRQVLY